VSFQKNSEAAREAGRKSAAIRWAKPGNEAERRRVAAMLREAQRAKAVAAAATGLSRMGLPTDPATIEQAATALQLADMRERAAKARDGKAAIRSYGEAWIARVHKLVTIAADKIVAEVNADAYPPLASTIYRVCYSAMADETDLPQSERNYQRLRERLEQYGGYVHQSVCAYVRPEGWPCRICGVVGIAENMSALR
jgi:hypothetical protein